ncbi:MAG: hypothetical protein LKK18_03675 [Clostridiales bacterium]|jgi:hypothetical protein|nr:hypothetical protein [Clostridiales bacterium]
MTGMMEEYGVWIVETIAGLGMFSVWQWIIQSGFGGLAAALMERIV